MNKFVGVIQDEKDLHEGNGHVPISHNKSYYT